MLTEKENLIRTMTGGKPDHFVNEWDAFAFTRDDPLLRYTRGKGRKKGCDWQDIFGTWMTWPDSQMFPVTKPGIELINDITEWEDYYITPDLSPVDNMHEWKDTIEIANKVDRNNQLLLTYMETGIFERMHFLMGFEDTLCNILMEPELCEKIGRKILEYKLEYARITIKYLHPDIILSHDDWGEKTRLFMQPDIWREIFKPMYAELYGYIKSEGIMVMHHSDSYCEPIVEDMADIGIDIWQGALPQNNIPAIQEKMKGRITLMGGIDTGIVDTADSTEEIIRKNVRETCLKYAANGYFIPSITYGGPGTLFPHVNAIVKDEIDKCSMEFFGNL